MMITVTTTPPPPQRHSLSSSCGALSFSSPPFATAAATNGTTRLLFHFHHAQQSSTSAASAAISTATARRGCSLNTKRITSFSTTTAKSKRTTTPPLPPPPPPPPHKYKYSSSSYYTPPPPLSCKSNFSSSSDSNTFFFIRCLPPSADSESFPPPPPPRPCKEEEEDESSHHEDNADEEEYTNNNNNNNSISNDDETEIEIEIESSSNEEDGKRKVPELNTLLRRFWKVAAPYWFSSDDISQARFRLAAVFALTLATTGISVAFNFLGRDFYNALANKDQEQFTKQLLYYLGGFAVGIPFFVLRDYAKDTLALRWRSWMTKYYMERYLQNQAFYKIQSQSIIDNPDQRIVDDLGSFASTALSFSLTLFNSVVDLISFSNILYGIYPPLFVVLLVYSLGGTAISVYLGRGLVTLNFLQEKKEADFRYGLVRVRENAESIAFYGGEDNEMQLLLQRFKNAYENFTQLLISSRNLEFFTNGYRYLIQILPAAVVAPMYFSGNIEFGVISQSVSAFNHILGDFSLIVFQFQSISAFSAVIDRLGEFDDILDGSSSKCPSDSSEEITLAYSYVPLSLESPNGSILTEKTQKLLHIENLTLQTPMSKATLIRDLSLEINKKDNMLVMGPSGSGKTSLLRALAGLWNIGKGKVTFYFHNGDDSQTSPSLQMFDPEGDIENCIRNFEGPISRNSRGIFFLPQKPYMVLGTLRQQLLYPTWADDVKTVSDGSKTAGSLPFLMSEPYLPNKSGKPSKPTTNDLIQVLENVRLGHLLSRFSGLDSTYEWSSLLSLGEQQRLAFARLLLSKPKLVLLDESTSALDETNEAHLYRQIEAAGITYISVGHRRTLCDYHNKILHISTADIGSNRRNWHIEPTNRDALSNSLNS